MIEGSRARSTKTQYKSKWTLFMAWCRDNELNPSQAGLPLLTRFLLYLFRERGVSVRTVKNYQSALAFYWRKIMNYEVPSDDRTLADLYKSMTRERPIPTRHIVDWDIRLVFSPPNSLIYTHFPTKSSH